MSTKVIFHIDMDAFFVSCERKVNHELKNKPVVVAQNHKRAIISAMSYEVKKLGFRVGDPFFKIKEKLKDTVIVSPHYELYSLVSKSVFEYLQKKYTNKIEIYSIDECYLDVTDLLKKYDSPIHLAKLIQDDILKNLDLPCSIGISYTKFLAKMSTNKAKPFGVLETKKEDIEKHFYDLPVDKIFGVGRATAPALHNANIHTYRDFVNCNNELFLRKLFNKNYFIFIQQLKGENENHDHVFKEEVKGIGNSLTFLKDLNSMNQLLNEFYKLSENVAKRAKDINQEGNVITISIRDTNRIWFSKQKKIDFYTNDVEKIYSCVINLFEEVWDENWVRGLGVRLSNLRSEFYANRQLDLFELNNNKTKTEKLINEINFQLGKNVLKTGKQLVKEKGKDTHNIRFLRRDIENQNIILDIDNNHKENEEE
ncbi:Y-family DNA polymerase [Metamycoplasma neophronis]|uniref:DNA polymerase IV n=1 Tax=Metamycoplasma neophronis TaxID=872983 RepID=A0ABY2Z1D0_9BACT|nr:DNA polymerase IV [Metamycoplasma neophronis]TPR54357.1 DNA polymerase IV [Metamycoplasma neophronis]